MPVLVEPSTLSTPLSLACGYLCRQTVSLVWYAAAARREPKCLRRDSEHDRGPVPQIECYRAFPVLDLANVLLGNPMALARSA